MAPHERLEAWRYAHRLTIEVYRVTRSWPTEERYGLSAQVRRCAYSVPANMVEGAAKRGRKEFARYLDISLGSHAELGYGLRLAEDLGYLSGEMLENRKPCTPRLAVSLAGSMRRSPAADGNLRLSTFLPSYRPTVLPSYRPTVLPSYRPTVLPSYRPTVLPSQSPRHIRRPPAPRRGLPGESRPPHGCEGEPLTQLHSRLVEGIHPVPRSRESGRQLIEHQQLPYGLRGQRGDGEGQVHPSHPCQGRRGGFLLGQEQLPHGVADEVGQLLRQAGPAGDVHFFGGMLYPDEGDHLVEGSLHIELHLAVLVGGAGGGHRSGSGVNHGPPAIHPLPQTLGPELGIPGREFPQPVGVGHQHVNAGSQPGVGRPVQRAQQGGGILEQVLLLRSLDGPAGAGHQPGDVDSYQRRREEPDRAEDAVAPAHPGWHLQRSDAVLERQLAQRPPGRVGGEGQVARRRIGSQRLVQPGPHYQVLGQGLRGATRLADHVHEDPPGIDAAQRRGDGGGVHVFENGDPGVVLPGFVVELIPGRRPEGIDQRLGPQGRAADPQHQHMVVSLADSLGELADRRDGFGLLSQSEKSILPVPVPGPHLAQDLGKPSGEI